MTQTLMMVAAAVCAAVLAVLVARGFAPRVRRTQLRRTLGAFPAVLLSQAGQWRSGTLRYAEESLEWFSDGSVRAELSIPRHLLEMRRQPADSPLNESLRRDASEAGNDWVVVDLLTPAQPRPVTVAMGFGESAGISAWIEAWGAVGRGHWR